ncbi:MAG: hypothetical protein CMJ49_01330 [Planctomycetaceae bacterium]|nr:hypothetical protein [Planctomycetaceae bacterium]
MNEQPYTRREFMGRSLAVVSTAATIPAFVQRSAFAIEQPDSVRHTAQRPGVPEDRILVVVQLGGGNDGLNTIVPYGTDDYYQMRPQLAVPRGEVLKLNGADGIGLHPQLNSLMRLYDDGLVAAIQGVGYPNPNRSHFKSMDIWHTGEPRRGQGYGWLGRYFDNTCEGAPDPNLCVAVGDQAPLAAQGAKVQPVAFQDERLFRWAGSDLHDDVAASYERINRAGPVEDVAEGSTASFLMRTALDAQVSSDRIRAAARTAPLVNYPRDQMGQSLKMVGSMIRAGLPTRVYYTSMSGFDTHAGQQWRHGNLLRQFSAAVAALYRDLKRQGNEKRVLIMSFSEFGRRVRENASGGTDHGTAAPMFLIGAPVRGGVHGGHPSLTQLDDNGDLKYHTDFRQVYAAILERWMGTDSAAILNGRFKALNVIAADRSA